MRELEIELEIRQEMEEIRSKIRHHESIIQESSKELEFLRTQLDFLECDLRLLYEEEDEL